jgi:hypothetical protein
LHKYKGLVSSAKTIVGEEGVAALWKGNVPTMLRQGVSSYFMWIVLYSVFIGFGFWRVLSIEELTSCSCLEPMTSSSLRFSTKRMTM